MGGSRVAESYYTMLMDLQITKPKLVVIDLFYISQDTKYSNSSQLHKMLDSYPNSIIKLIAIGDILGKKDLLDNEIEYLFPFSIYHSRWSELEKNDFVVSTNNLKGADYRINVAEAIEINDYASVDSYRDDETENMKYMRKIIEYCQENNIDVLFTYLPNYSSEIEISASKYAQKICEEYDVDFINFLDTNKINIINNNTDFYNIQYEDETNAHLNPSGARKVTDYIGKYIMQNYNVSDQRDNEAYSFWYEDYDEYIDLKIKNLKDNRENLNNYLMLLYDEKDIEYEIKVQSTLKIEEDSTLYYLLENLDNNYEIDDTAFMELNEKTGEYELKEKTIKITTWDKRTDKQLDEVWF